MHDTLRRLRLPRIGGLVLLALVGGAVVSAPVAGQETVATPGPFGAVTAGGEHSCALRSDATITCWGDNEYGRADAPGGRFSAVTAG